MNFLQYEYLSEWLLRHETTERVKEYDTGFYEKKYFYVQPTRNIHGEVIEDFKQNVNQYVADEEKFQESRVGFVKQLTLQRQQHVQDQWCAYVQKNKPLLDKLFKESLPVWKKLPSIYNKFKTILEENNMNEYDYDNNKTKREALLSANPTLKKIQEEIDLYEEPMEKLSNLAENIENMFLEARKYTSTWKTKLTAFKHQDQDIKIMKEAAKKENVLILFDESKEDYLKNLGTRGEGYAALRLFKKKNPPRAWGIPTRKKNEQFNLEEDPTDAYYINSAIIDIAMLAFRHKYEYIVFPSDTSESSFTSFLEKPLGTFIVERLQAFF